MKKKLEWYAYRYNINRKKIEVFNIFEHANFIADFYKLCDENLNKLSFEDRLDRILLYYYWSKSEHEIIIVPWIGDRDIQKKIDIYSQVKINWKHFVNYCWAWCKGEDKNDE